MFEISSRNTVEEMDELLENIDPRDYVFGVDEMITVKLIELQTYWGELALKKRKISKDVRNEMTSEYIGFLLNIIKDLSTRVNIGETKIYALSGLIDGTSEEAILKTKIKTLEEENETLKAKMLDIDSFKASSASVHNLQELKSAIIEELPKIIKNERIEACNTLFNTLEKRNEGI